LRVEDTELHGAPVADRPEVADVGVYDEVAALAAARDPYRDDHALIAHFDDLLRLGPELLEALEGLAVVLDEPLEPAVDALVGKERRVVENEVLVEELRHRVDVAL